MDRDWANLPKLALYLVVEKLETPKEFSFVCKAWRWAAKDMQTQCVMKTTPMLMIYSFDTQIEKWNWSLYNAVDDKVLKTQIQLPKYRFCGSSKGWLVVIFSNFPVSLINPFFRVGKQIRMVVNLPPLSPPNVKTNKHGHFFVFKTSISADPILDPDNCIVMVSYGERCELAFIRLNKDSEWTYVDNKLVGTLWEVVQFEDRFYVLGGLGKLSSFKVTAQSISDVKEAAREYEDENLGARKYYLVVCNEKRILMVQKCVGFNLDRETKKFKAYELNISKGEWTEVNALGDVAVFVGDNSSISVCASEVGCRPNCIYFIHDNVRIGRDIGPEGAFDYGVYNIEEKRFIQNPFHQDARTLMSNTIQFPIWILPTYNL